MVVVVVMRLITGVSWATLTYHVQDSLRAYADRRSFVSSSFIAIVQLQQPIVPLPAGDFVTL